MILTKLSADHPDIPALKALFEEAFPVNERPVSMDDIIANLDMMPCDLLGIYPEETPDTFVGFFFVFRTETFAYLVYFATCPEKRSGGLGSKAINALREYLGETPLVFSYESIYEESDNAVQRERRRNFYLKNGFYETGWFGKMNGSEFIIASSREDFDKEAFEAFMSGIASGAGAPAPELYRRD